MTFILSNITNWLTDSQSSDLVETDAEFLSVPGSCDTESGRGHCTELRMAEKRGSTGDSDGVSSAAESDSDLPGISHVMNSAIEWGGRFVHIVSVDDVGTIFCSYIDLPE